MKVLYLAPERTKPGRLTGMTFVDEEIHALSAAGVEAFILAPDLGGDEVVGRARLVAVPPGRTRGERLGTIGFASSVLRHIPLVYFRSLQKLFYVLRLERMAAQVIRTRGIDLIHSHFGWPGGFAGMLARAQTGVPLVTSLRGMDVLADSSIDYGLRQQPGYDAVMRRLLATAERTMFVSEFLRRQAVPLGLREETARVVPKGVDLVHFAYKADTLAAKRELGLTGPVVLTVAGLIRRKGVDHILRALARLPADQPFTFVVCGEGPERRELEQLAADLGIVDHTRFEGTVPRDVIPRYFAACDVFVLASLHEASGNVLLEAMATGRPIVCTDSGGPPEYVAHGSTGFVVPPGDAAALSTGIRALLEDPALARALGIAGRRRAEEEYGYDRMISNILQIYVAALTGAAPANSRLPLASSAAGAMRSVPGLPGDVRQ